MYLETDRVIGMVPKERAEEYMDALCDEDYERAEKILAECGLLEEAKREIQMPKWMEREMKKQQDYNEKHPSRKRGIAM